MATFAAEKNKWDLKLLDDYVDKSEETGVSLLLPLGLSPTWASARPEESSAYNQPGWAAEPQDLNDWRNYVRTIMQ